MELNTGNFTRSTSAAPLHFIWSRNVKGEQFILNQICDYNIINHNLLLIFLKLSTQWERLFLSHRTGNSLY